MRNHPQARYLKLTSIKGITDRTKYISKSSLVQILRLLNSTLNYSSLISGISKNIMNIIIITLDVSLHPTPSLKLCNHIHYASSPIKGCLSSQILDRNFYSLLYSFGYTTLRILLSFLYNGININNAHWGPLE